MPFQRTFEVVMKLVPVAFRVKAAPPAAALAGAIEDRIGAGLFAGGGGVLVAAADTSADWALSVAALAPVTA